MRSLTCLISKQVVNRMTMNDLEKRLPFHFFLLMILLCRLAFPLSFYLKGIRISTEYFFSFLENDLEKVTVKISVTKHGVLHSITQLAGIVRMQGSHKQFQYKNLQQRPQLGHHSFQSSNDGDLHRIVLQPRAIPSLVVRARDVFLWEHSLPRLH